MKGRPILSRKIQGGTPSGSIEAMCWVRDRLLSTGLSGAVVEWDLKKLGIKNSVLVTGHAAWCIDVTKSYSKIAVGTEQGFVNIFTVENDSLQYEKLFDKQDGRILCCKFDKTENILVTGNLINYILQRIFDFLLIFNYRIRFNPNYKDMECRYRSSITQNVHCSC